MAAQQLLNSPQNFYDESVLNLEPVYDDNPFFYHFLKTDKLIEFYRLFDGKWEALIEGGLLLPLILCIIKKDTLFY